MTSCSNTWSSHSTLVTTKYNLSIQRKSDIRSGLRTSIAGTQDFHVFLGSHVESFSDGGHLAVATQCLNSLANQGYDVRCDCTWAGAEEHRYASRVEGRSDVKYGKERILSRAGGNGYVIVPLLALAFGSLGEAFVESSTSANRSLRKALG